MQQLEPATCGSTGVRANLVSLTVATERLSEPGETIDILETAMGLPEQERLRETFLA